MHPEGVPEIRSVGWLGLIYDFHDLDYSTHWDIPYGIVTTSDSFCFFVLHSCICTCIHLHHRPYYVLVLILIHSPLLLQNRDRI